MDISRKKPRSSFGVVSTVREGGSHWWAVKGTLVSTVRTSEEEKRRVAATREGRKRDEDEVVDERRLRAMVEALDWRMERKGWCGETKEEKWFFSTQ